MNAELGFGIIRGFEGPELAGTPAQQTCSRCERAHGLCRRSSKLGFLLVASRLRRTMNCRGFFGLLFSYPFGLFIPRVLDT